MASINASVTNTGLISSGDATGILQLQSDGTTGLTVNANANVTVNTNLFVSGAEVEPLVQGTAQNTTSGTSIDFTGIPNWVKRITVMFSGVSTNGTSSLLIRLGTTSGVVSTGYTSAGSIWATTGNNGANSTAGFIIYNDNTSYTISGSMTITNVASNTWVTNHTFGSGAQLTGLVWWGGGTVSLASTLDRVRITTVNGTDTFDAGSINILYE